MFIFRIDVARRISSFVLSKIKIDFGQAEEDNKKYRKIEETCN